MHERSQRQTRSYDRISSVVFLKTHEPFGGLSNMAGGYPLLVQGVRIYSSEALYQACRFPHLPEVQRSIIAQASPMTAKMKSKPYRKESRPDWDRVRVKVMRWCLRVKLCQNWSKFSALLLQTGSRPIVEESRKDAFWGAKSVDDQTLVGMNVLGRLLMELREVIRSTNAPVLHVGPLDIPDFLLLGRQIEAIHGGYEAAEQSTAGSSRPRNAALGKEQKPLFEEISTSEGLPSETRSVFAHDPQSIALYPVLKDSGVPWLGQVPAHWSIMPGLAVYKPRLLKNTGMRESRVLSLSYGRITVKSAEKLRGLVPESFETYQIVQPGNIIIRTTDLQNDQTSLRIGIAEDRGIITSAYMCLETTSLVSPQFGYQYLNACDLLKVIYGLGSGLRQNLDFGDIKRMPVLVPPPAEQTAIVRFLNYVDRQIQRYIRAKQKVIKLLEEQKQVIINRAVTRGVDPNVRLVPSDVEWLGEVPEHWEVTRLKFVASEIVDCLHATPVYSTNGEYPAIRTADVRPGELLLKSARRVDEGHYRKWTARLTPTHGDILYTREGERFGIAAMVPANTFLCISQRMMAFRIHPQHNPAYFMWQINCRHVYAQAAADVIGAAAPHVNVDRIKNFWLVSPPRSEQDEISIAIQTALSAPNVTIAKARDEIALLREYRTRLIADVVTGKLDARDVAARLRDETGEPELLDDIGTETSPDDESIEDLDEPLETIEA